MRLADLCGSELHGGFLDQPKAGAVLDARMVDVLGWALGGRRRAVAAEISIDGRPLARTRLRAPRPDLAAAFPDRKEARRAGFRTTLDLMGDSAQFELQVSIVLKRGAREHLAWICGRRRWRRERSPAYAQLASVVVCCGCQAPHLEQAKHLDVTSPLAAALESVLAQRYPHVEVVVVHDGRTEKAASIAARYRGVRCVREQQGGAAASRNTGIRATNGDFLLFLAAEDRLPPDVVERGVGALQAHPECAAAIGAGVCPHAIYRRSLFEHMRFDSAIDERPSLAFNRALARELPLCSYEIASAGHHVHGCDMSEHV